MDLLKDTSSQIVREPARNYVIAVTVEMRWELIPMNKRVDAHDKPS